jgi:hypothetical protein
VERGDLLKQQRRSIVVTNLKVAGSRPDEALGPGVYSASNRNEYQKHKNNVSGE